MFGRSQSGPGGLSINTNQANSLPASSSSQAPASGGLFGSLQKDKPSQSLFGASLSASQPHQSSNIFGSNSAQPSQTTSLFGAPINQSQSTTIPSINPPTTQDGGLFGTSGMSTQPSFGNLFGPGNPQTQSQSSGGLFASLGQNQAHQKPQTTSLFGGLNEKKESSILTALSGPAQTQNQAQQPPSQPSLFATSIGQYTQRQQAVPGVRVTTSELRPTTRFTDLHEQLQTIIEHIDGFIQQQIKYQQECAAMNLAIDENCNQIPKDVDFCTRTLDTMQHALENDAEAISRAKSLTKQDVANAKLSFTAVESLTIPQSYQAANLWALPPASRDAAPSLLHDEDNADGSGSASLVSLFSTQADDMSTSLDGYKRNIAEVESYLRYTEVNTLQQMQQLVLSQGQDGQGKSAEDRVRELVAVFRDFENGILKVAGKVGGAREKVQELVLDNYRN
ncbi:MAG: hypothetical protein Q9220_001660 [cf. Caloplaca sp. 1 TL-2023]